MSSKMNQIPFLSSYEDVRAEMNRDLQYRLNSRTAQTSLGRPLYYRINVQMITTQECPFHCPFCLERQNPMSGDNDFDAQIEALKRVLAEHPDARLSITGGEPVCILSISHTLFRPIRIIATTCFALSTLRALTRS